MDVFRGLLGHAANGCIGALMMRATTLKATAGSLAGLVAYYSRLRDEPRARGLVDYYLDPEEPAGRWWGQGARELGLDGDVAGPDLRAVLDAAHPASDAPLGRPFRDASARGFDATFSPKDLSPDHCGLIGHCGCRSEVLIHRW
jgi:hypothetical protein